MRYISTLLILIVVAFNSCSRRDAYAYTCQCTNNETGTVDSIITYRTETSGEAQYLCETVADSVNKGGRNFTCNID